MPDENSDNAHVRDHTRAAEKAPAVKNGLDVLRRSANKRLRFSSFHSMEWSTN